MGRKKDHLQESSPDSNAGQAKGSTTFQVSCTMETVPLLLNSLYVVKESDAITKCVKETTYLRQPLKQHIIGVRQCCMADRKSCNVFSTFLGEDTHKARGLVGIVLENDDRKGGR